MCCLPCSEMTEGAEEKVQDFREPALGVGDQIHKQKNARLINSGISIQMKATTPAHRSKSRVQPHHSALS